MELNQIMANVITIVPAIGSVYAFFHIFTKDRIDRMEDYHRADMKEMKEEQKAIDAKWERLFERLLIQDKERKS